MESTIIVSPTTMAYNYIPLHHHFQRVSFLVPKITNLSKTVHALSNNGSIPRDPALARTVQDSVRQRGTLESLFCYDKSIPEEIIEKPIGISVAEKIIGDKSPCPDCRAKGVVLCSTCTGCGLYIDSILESQGIMVKVRCLGCGGTGNIMCSDCGGRGHL